MSIYPLFVNLVKYIYSAYCIFGLKTYQQKLLFECSLLGSLNSFLYHCISF